MALVKQFQIGIRFFRIKTSVLTKGNVMAVTKSDVVEKLISRVGFSRKESVDTVEQLLKIMKTSLENGDNILISRFGKFSVKKKKERVGRNPATGDKMMLRQLKVVTFQHSATLKELMNKA